MTREWKTQTADRLWPEPHDDDHVLLVKGIEARIKVHRSHVAYQVYPEPQRPQDQATGTIYGRSVIPGIPIDYVQTDEDRERAVTEAKKLSEKMIDMLLSGMSETDVYRESGSLAWWDKQRERERAGWQKEPS